MPTWDINFNHCLEVRDVSLISLIVEIESYKRSVLKIPIPPGLKEKLNKINIIRQIRGTTAIEGNSLTEEQIKETLAKNTSNSKEEQEALNADSVHKFILKWRRKQPDGTITEELICKIHELCTTNIEYDQNIPGQYRRHAVIAGNYLPPSHESVPNLMKEFITFINSNEMTQGFGPLLRAILAHFYLISIHPFGDGNGRTSRALEAYILFSGGYNVYGFYSLANYFYIKRNDYINHLMDARFKHNGRLQKFVIFALEGFVHELKTVQDTILDFVRRAVYKDYLDECYSQSRLTPRCEVLARIILTIPDGISEVEFRTKKHPLSREFYKEIKSERTIERDLKLLQNLYLIKIENGRLKTNLDFLNNLEDGA